MKLTPLPDRPTSNPLSPRGESKKTHRIHQYSEAASAPKSRLSLFLPEQIPVKKPDPSPRVQHTRVLKIMGARASSSRPGKNSKYPPIERSRVPPNIQTRICIWRSGSHTISSDSIRQGGLRQCFAFPAYFSGDSRGWIPGLFSGITVGSRFFFVRCE